MTFENAAISIGKEPFEALGKTITDISQAGAEEIPTYLGIPIPAEVIRQLKMLTGLPISRLSADDIGEAVRGYEFDTQINEDPGGITLSDKMHLDWDEIPAESFGTYAHNFEPVKPSEATIFEWGKEVLEEAAEALPPMSFVERYLTESANSVLQFV